MIDQEWLNSLDCVSADAFRVKGLAGIGSEKVVLNATAPDGRAFVMPTCRNLLGYHIREISPNLSGKPSYDLNRLNRKIGQLVGDNTLDAMTSE
jgi:hypothetical protein